MAKNHMW